MTTAPTASSSTKVDESTERHIIEAISLDTPWAVLERFSSLTRSSGSKEEREAFEILRGHLQEWGIPHQLHEPEAFISIPLSASVRVGDRTFRAKTPAMSVSTGGQEITGELLYMPSAAGQNTGDVFSAGVDLSQVDVRGKVIISEGMASPGKVKDAMEGGALAGIFINPGEAIHEGICTTIWGTPDVESAPRQPTIPVLAVNAPDGQELIKLAQQGSTVSVATNLDAGWRRIPVLVAEIPGNEAPEEFVLLHGHVDSWHVGIGDNATGNVTKLELARVFWQQRQKLQRSLRIAWWSGHSHGRYAGSTWYSDTFGIDLARNCVAQVNCDSPGCRWASTYNHLNAMSETEPFVDTVIRETTGIAPEMERPHRAGDYSFNDIGISSFYMLSSTMSEEDRADKEFYAVGGCGANIQWHTEGDTMEIADRDNLLRDMKTYAASVFRTLTAPLHPFDWTRTTDEFRKTLADYQNAAGSEFDFGPSNRAVAELEEALNRFYVKAPADGGVGSPAVQRFNFVQRRLARLLVPVNYSEMRMFFHDPALTVPPLPDLAPALTLPNAKGDVAQRGIVRAHLTRGQNRLVWTLQLARETVDAALV